jgi:hypothetical protein
MLERIKFSLVFSLLVAIAGCGSKPIGESISGVITVDGQPMQEGLITFEPMERTTGPKISTMIDNGSYLISPTEGIHAGIFRVEILGIPPGVKALADGRGHSESPVRPRSAYREVAAEFNFQSRLFATVVKGVSNQFDFQVTLKD